ncbi:MAG TPA: hypothetical protein VFU53_03505 [Burkholderiales bacterium]|nr:hypothetical protein [Burkholderiales bacterium]
MIREGDTLITPAELGEIDEWTAQNAERAGLIETVGARQAELLLRARSSSTGTLVLPHNRERDTERSAARRLVLRGLLRAPNAMGSPRFGYLYFYGLTERGRTAWLRVKS